MSSSSQADAERSVRVRQQEVVKELGQRALGADDPAELLGDAATAVAETLDAEFCDVLELSPGGDEGFLREGIGWQEGLVGSATVPTDHDSRAGHALLSGEPVVVRDLRTETRFSRAALLRDHGVVSGISVVVGPVDDPWGVLGVHATERREFSGPDADFVANVANVLASAIENERTRRRLQAEETLKERIVETSPVGITVFDGAGEIRFANERAVEILGRSRGELRGMSYDDPAWDLVDADGEPVPDDERPFQRVMDAGRPVYDAELGVRRPDGDRVWLSVNGAPLPGDEGEAVFVLEDVTERRRLESELETVFGRVTDAFYALDGEFRFTLVNDRAEQLLQHSEEELLGERLWDVFPEAAERDAVRESFEAAMETQEPQSYEVYYEPLDFWVEATVYPSESGVSVYFRDVTERIERERELRKSESRYRTIAEHIPNGLVVMFDEDCRYTLASGQAFDDLPLSGEDLVGNRPQGVFDEDLAAALESMYRATLDGEQRTIEREYAGRVWRIEVAPIREDDGTITGGASIIQDVTEHKRNQRKLEESERRYRTLAEHFPNGAVGVYDHDLRYTLTEGAVLGDTLPAADRIEGETVGEVFPPEVVADLEPLLRAAIEDGETDSITVEFGDRAWRVWATPLRDADGDIFAGLSFAQDITEQVEREEKLEDLVEKLEASNERLEQFAYAASHDLQEPLRMVSSYLQLIEKRYGDELDDEGREFLAFAVDGADRMREMINGLLEYARVDTRGDPFEPVELDDVLAAVEENLQVKIEESDAEITAEPLPRVEGDAGQLRQVFQNLLSNAIEYSGEEPPRIHVAASREDDAWKVSVSDEGVGIDPADADRVFEVFQSLHDRTEGAGTGIGLALCERIVERHGGDVWIESGPGDGTTVSFTLPPAGDDDG